MAIEALANHPNNVDLQLIGVDKLTCCSNNLKFCVESKDITDQNKFVNIFGEKTNFFYAIEQVKNNSIFHYERGIGHVYSTNDGTFLNRSLTIVSGKNPAESQGSLINHRSPLLCQNDTYIYSTIPQSFIEYFCVPNSVIVTNEIFVPNILPLAKDSFLARIDNNIESVPFDDNRLIDKIVSLICKFTKQIKLKTSKLSLKRVEPEVIDFVPSSAIKAKKGSLYYDENSNTLKIFNGLDWKTIAFVED